MTRVLIVGGGRPVYFLARAFLEKGHEIVLVNRSPEECTWLARRLRATVVCGDGSEPLVLEDAGITECDVVVAATPHDEDNLVICQLAAVRFGIGRTLAVVEDPEHERVFRELGVHGTVSPARVVSELIERRAEFEDIVSLIPAAEGRLNVAEVQLSAGSPVVGRAVREVNLPADCLIAAVLRGEEVIVPHGDTDLRTGDYLLVIASPESYGRALRAVTGEKER